jgi:hypothetical protein
MAIGIGAAVVIAVTVVIVLLATSTSTPSQSVAYTNISQNFRTCLLTTTADTTTATPTWAAVQRAKTQVTINAQRVTAPAGPTTQLVPYLNSLIAMKCGLIITAGTDLTDATAEARRAQPQQHLIAVNTPDQAASITDIVIGAARGRFPAARPSAPTTPNPTTGPSSSTR